MRERTLRDLYCQAFDCAPEEFAERAFWQCCYAHATVLARLIRSLNRNSFGWDLELLKTAAHATDLLGLDAEIQYFRYRRRTISPLRDWLRLRVSGRTLLHLAAGLFRKSSPAPVTS